MADAQVQEVQRRKGHLGRLALVFFHRGGSWVDFRDFLDRLFSNGLPIRAKFTEQPCRHGIGGRHHTVLESLTTVGASGPPEFRSDPQFSRACVGFGKGDADKSPGIVVSDLCIRARQFLEERGKGRIIRHATPRHERALGQGLDVQHRLQLSEEVYPHAHPAPPRWEDLVMTDPEAWAAWELFGVLPTQEEDPNLLESEDFEAASTDEDEGDIDDPGDRLLSSTLLSSDRVTTSSSPMPGNARVRKSTKIRVPTLAVLKNAGRDINLFRTTFYRLREGGEAVLHLCGCGIKFTNTDDPTDLKVCSGCVEPSHLTLGSWETNRDHLIWHKAIGKARVADYAALCQIAWNSAPDCEGLF